MISHEPKYAALQALNLGRLSAKGRERLQRHLRGCVTCREALSAVESYETLRTEARDQDVPELNWDRFEKALDQDRAPLPSRAPRARLIAVSLPFLAVAATILLGWFAHSVQRQELATAPKPAAVAPQTAAVEEQPASAWITLASGTSEVSDPAFHAAAPGFALREGMVLRSGPDAELHVSIEGGSGIVLEPDSELRIARLRAKTLVLDLTRGAVFQQVKKLAGDERFEVTFGPYTAAVRGTHFRVSKRPVPGVAVFEGRVVVSANGTQVADLSAGQTWQESAADPQSLGADRAVYGASPNSQRWVNLQLPAVDGSLRWHFDGVTASAQHALSMRVPPGSLALGLEDLRGKERTVTVQVTPEGSTLDEAAIRAQFAAQMQATGYLAPEQIQPVVRAGLDAMRRCYERSLRRDPKLVGKLKLSMRIGADGHVVRATARGEVAALPIELEACLELEARSWKFPRPEGGGAVSFDVPLQLKSE